jgi:hypothetical protein
MVTTRYYNETKNAHQYIKVCYIINTVWLLHVSTTLMAISREVHYKDEYVWILQKFVCEQVHRYTVIDFENIWYKIHNKI